MTDQMTSEDAATLGLDPESVGQLDPNIRAQLRKTAEIARARDAAEAEATTAKRELAFARAGVPLDTPEGQLFQRGYDGDPTDPAAIKTAFDGVFGSKAVTEAHNEPSADEMDAQRRLAQASAGGPATGTVPFEQAIKSANSQDAVMALIRGAPEGAGVVPPEVD